MSGRALVSWELPGDWSTLVSSQVPTKCCSGVPFSPASLFGCGSPRGRREEWCWQAGRVGDSSLTPSMCVGEALSFGLVPPAAACKAVPLGTDIAGQEEEEAPGMKSGNGLLFREEG